MRGLLEEPYDSGCSCTSLLYCPYELIVCGALAGQLAMATDMLLRLTGYRVQYCCGSCAGLYVCANRPEINKY
jgi:hypothetical protein